MNTPSQNNIILQSVGSTITNYKGEHIGEISEITQDKSGTQIEYVIIKSTIFFGQEERFFAIPASPSLIKITEGGSIILNADKDDLQFARGISKDECPKPNFEFNQSIFELYNYKVPTAR